MGHTSLEPEFQPGIFTIVVPCHQWSCRLAQFDVNNAFHCTNYYQCIYSMRYVVMFRITYSTMRNATNLVKYQQADYMC